MYIYLLLYENKISKKILYKTEEIQRWLDNSFLSFVSFINYVSSPISTDGLIHGFSFES